MKKSTKNWLKQKIAWLLIVLMSINTFAAVVGDNDGAAFITKAEFESLKNDFQSQINRYNSSLDNKLDGAIASYISGIKINPKSKKNIIYNNWKEYTMLNYALENTFQMPKLTVAYTWQHNANFGINNSSWVLANRAIRDHQYHEQGGVFGGFRIPEQAGAKKCVVDVYKKNNVELIGSESDGLAVDKNIAVWKGQTTDFKETIDIIRYDYLDGLNNSANELPSALNLQLWFLKSFSFVLDYEGYHASGLSLDQVWNPEFKYTSTGWPGGNSRSNQVGWQNLTWTCSANDYAYEHVGTYKDDLDWQLTVPSWSHTWRLATNTTITSKTLYNSKSSYSRGGWIKDAVTYVIKDWPWGTDDVQAKEWWEVFMPNSVITNFTNSSAVNVFNTLEVKMPQIALAGNLKSNQIYQTRDKVSYNISENQKFEMNPLCLNEGYPLLYAVKDTEVEWTPIFKNLSGTGVSDASEVNIALSYGKFVNGIDCNNKYITKKDDTSSTNMIWKTSGLKTTIKFTMLSDGFIIAKWWPGNMTKDAAKSVKWSITLDNENSNSMYVIEP